MSPPGSAFSLVISATTSPRITVELFQVASWSPSVVDTTYLRMLFILSANSFCIVGQALAKPWYVTRPSSNASLANSSSTLNLLPSAPRSNWNDQPPCSNASAPPGSSITPSRMTNSLTTILAMSFSLSDRRSCAGFSPPIRTGRTYFDSLSQSSWRRAPRRSAGCRQPPPQPAQEHPSAHLPPLPPLSTPA